MHKRQETYAVTVAVTSGRRRRRSCDGPDDATTRLRTAGSELGLKGIAR